MVNFKEMTVKARFTISQHTIEREFSLYDMGLSEKEWAEMSLEDKEIALRDMVEDDRAYWLVDHFNEVE